MSTLASSPPGTRASFGGEAGAALVFLVAYLVVFAWMLFGFFTHRLKWRSRYLLLFFHVTIRLASQGCGIAFGVLGFSNVNVFLAFLILGAEGYFSLVLCAFRFLISWHQHNLASGESWLAPRDAPTSSASKLRKALQFSLLGRLASRVSRGSPMGLVHCLLIGANVAIVVGGSYLAGADLAHPASRDTRTSLRVSKIARSAGQSVFLAINTALLFVILATIRDNRRDGDARGRKGTTHPTLVLLFIAWFPLIVRGIFGLLQACVWSLSYYNPVNYNAGGFTSRFTALEYILGVLTEWLACIILNATYLTSRHDPEKRAVAGVNGAERGESDDGTSLNRLHGRNVEA
ncbi:unnamed protein product [Mycena citricolor]|uniref:Uncharacterized protein n=1 Tax=Mycena citricolor TaxID=2018698 RepID=A0AAD2JWJ2_9AGAR|nr:unnamed protein product [Mycena citricolor]